jgi:radical SAM superfamily enzyme YgiQ (UPF0313 family)
MIIFLWREKPTMRFNKVLLVQPRYSSSHYGAYRPPAGLGYLAEVLKRNGIDYDVLDMDQGYDYRHLKEKIDAYAPDIVGVTMLSLDFKKTYKMLVQTKSDFPHLPLTVGGAHISVMREEALNQCTAIDYGVVLEGEFTFLELCQGMNPDTIPGLIYRSDQNLVYTGDRAFVKELDSIPWPRYDRFDMDKYILREVTVITSRGCPHNCIYCPVNLAIGKKMRFRSADNVADEIEHWIRKGYRFYVGDDNFTASKKRVYQICDQIEQRGLVGAAELQCLNGVRADRVDRGLLKRMKEVGFTALAFGVEGGNEEMLRIIKKGERLADIEVAIQDACDLGFDVTLFFLVGVPGETMSDFEDSVALALKYPIADVRFYNLIPFPRTEVYDFVSRNNYFIYDEDSFLDQVYAWGTDPVFATPEFPAEQRRKALEIGHKVRLRVRRQFAKRRLKKFGPLAGPLSTVFVQPVVQSVLFRNGPIRRLAENIDRILSRRKIKPIGATTRA